MGGALRDALWSARAGRRRLLLRALGTCLAAAMLALAVTVGYGLHTGFARSSRAADLPDVIARFDRVPAHEAAARIRALPDVAAFSLREEVDGTELSAGTHSASDGVLEVLEAGRRGYQLLAGRDVSQTRGGVVVEAGVAHAWGLTVGSVMEVAGLGAQRIIGIARAPENVAYPLASPRVYVSRATVQAYYGVARDPNVDLAEIWLRDPAQLEAVLVQARTTSYGLQDLSIVTRNGVRLLIDEAAGIVIALLAALSLVALLTAAAMLAAAARADVQRRLQAIGVRRAIGATPRHVAAACALEALLAAAPAAALGVTAGALLGSAPSARLLALLNEASPGSSLALPLAGCFLLAVAIPVGLAAWPAWRAASRAPVALLRGAELRSRRLFAPGLPRLRGSGGLFALGVRLTLARRVRLAASVASLAACCAFVLLLLALASELSTLENDPAALGRRYQLSASLPASAARRVRSLDGVAAVAPRYQLNALDSFSLGELIEVIAYGGDQARFEDPPLLAGHARRGPDQAEVGLGLAQVLGLRVGSQLALALPSGGELRLRVAGIVSSLQRDGRVAYVPAAALLAQDTGAPEQLAVLLAPGASSSNVAALLGSAGASVSKSAGVAGGGGALVEALESLLRAVAGLDVLVCLYTLVQTLWLTASERRRELSLLRACGAAGGSVRALLAGTALTALVPAALIGIALERLALGPAIARLAAGYASLSLSPQLAALALLLGALALLACVSVAWVAGRSMARPPAAGLT